MSNERANAAHAAKEQHGAASSSPHVGAFASCCTIRRGSYKCSAVKGKRCTRAKERRGGGLLFSIRRGVSLVVYIGRRFVSRRLRLFALPMFAPRAGVLV